MPTKIERIKILNRQEWACGGCGKPIMNTDSCNMDHIHPLKWGGSNKLNNFSALCKKCHIEKHQLEVFSQGFGFDPYRTIPFTGNYTWYSDNMYKYKEFINRFLPEYAECRRQYLNAYYAMRRWVKWAKRRHFGRPNDYNPRTYMEDYKGRLYT